MIENNNFEAENLQQQIQQSDYPSIDNFLKNGFSNDTKIIIDNIFNNDSDLKDSFESFLKTASLQDKMVCKKHLLSAKDENEIKNILLENIPGGCRIAETILDSSLGDDINNIQSIREEEQDNMEEEQDNMEEEQDNREDGYDITNKIDIVRQYEETMDLRDRLVAEYPTLENDTKQGSKAYNDIKDLLQNNGTLDKLTDFGIEQDEYISLLATINVAQNNPEYQDLRESQDFSLFYMAMKNLNNACNIPDTSFDSFTENNIANTRTELFHETIGNKGLIEQRQRNIETHSSDYERLFSVESDDELIQNYGRFLDGDGRRLMEKRLSNPTSLSGDENDNLMNFVLFKQKEIEDKTKNMVEELCMTSQVKGFLSCIPKEYANQFQFNKANEIHVDQNGILQLNGHINGINFSLKQDTSDVNARLQTSTMLSKDQDNKFDFTGKYNNSPFILPTSSQVFDTALLSLQSEELSKIQNQDDYFDILQSSILKSMDKLYANTKYTQHYIDSQIKNDLVVNDVKNIIFNLGGTSLSKIGESDGKLYEFFDMIYFNLQSMTNHEKKKFCECLNKLGNLIRNEGHESGNNGLAKDEMLSRFLGSKDITTKILGKMMLTEDEKKSWSFFDFFKLFLSKSEINVDSLYKFLSNPNENGEDIWTKFDQINGTDTRNEYLDANLEAGLQEAFKL